MDQNYHLFKGYKTIFWGIFLTSFHFNFMGIPILPQFIEWLIVVKGINLLKDVQPTKSLIYASECGSWLAFFTFIGGFVSLFKPDIFNSGTLFTIIWSTGIMTLQLILKYYILVGSIELLEIFHKPDAMERYIKSTRNFIISYIVIMVFQIISQTIVLESWLAVSGITAIIINIWFMIFISEFKNLFMKEVTDG